MFTYCLRQLPCYNSGIEIIYYLVLYRKRLAIPLPNQSNVHFSTWKAYQCTMGSVPERLNTISKGQGPKKHLQKLLSKGAAPREWRGVRGKQSTSPDKPRSRLELLPSNGRSQDLGNPMPSVHGCFSPRVHNDQPALNHPKHTSESIRS